MAAKQSIANPVVVLGLDAGPFTAGLEKAKQAGTAAAKNISAAAKGAPKLPTPSAPSRAAGAAPGGGLLGGVTGAGGGLLSGIGGMIRSPLMGLAAANQVFELGAKVSKVFGAPIRALMQQEELTAKFSGIGTVGETSMTAGIARFGDEFNAMLVNIAKALDETFDIKGKLEFIRGVMSGVSELIRAFMVSLGVVLKDPDAMKKMFAAGQKALIDAFETVGVASVKVVNYFIEIYKIVGGMKGLFQAMTDQLAIGLSSALEAVFLVPAGTTALLEQDAVRNANRIAKEGAGRFKPFDEQAPVNIANAARAAIAAAPVGAGEAARIKEMRQADIIMGKIGGTLANLGGMIASQIAPAMQAGTANLDEALVKATLQGQGGDIQQRIEAAIQEQLVIQTQQATLLERIRATIAAKPGLAVLGGV